MIARPLICINEHDENRAILMFDVFAHYWVAAALIMDKEFDDALRTLAEHQLRHGIGSVLLALAQPSGDIVVSVPRGGRYNFVPYARVDGRTKQLVRLRS
jgi:hypothetical protein